LVTQRHDAAYVGGSSTVIGIGMANERHQLSVQVEATNRDEVDDADSHSFAKQCGALRDERVARLRAILVRRTDQLDRGNQASFSLNVENANLVLILVGRFRIDRESGAVQAAVAMPPFPLAVLVRGASSHSKAPTSISIRVPRWTRGSATKPAGSRLRN
jgi:hypothetical protein